MVQHQEIVITDDFTGERGAAPHDFELDGTHYQIDLGEENAKAFDDALAPFVEKARRVSGKKSTAAPRRFSRPAAPVKVAHASNGNGFHTDATDATVAAWRQAVRAWYPANAERLNLPPLAIRGRIAGSIQDAYRKSLAQAVHDEYREAPTLPAPTPAPEAAAEVRTRGRRAKPAPPAADLIAAYNQSGTYAGVAEVFGTTIGLATKWVKVALAAQPTVNA